jgi:hypothetical protein
MQRVGAHGSWWCVFALGVASGSACSVSSSSAPSAKLETGTIRIVAAYTRHGALARNADVIVHTPDGEIYGRATLDSNGSAVVDSVADATVSVAIRGNDSNDVANIVEVEDGSITTYTHVPLDATLQFNKPNAYHGPDFRPEFEVPLVEGQDGYQILVGCYDDSRYYRGPVFRAWIPEGCGERPRTVMASPTGPNWWRDFYSVRRDVDLHQAGPIQMPGYEPARVITNAMINLDDTIMSYDSDQIVIVENDAHYAFHGPDHQPRVPQGDWSGTQYKHHVLWKDPHEVRYSNLDYFEAGSPRDMTVDARGFLVPPTRGEGRFGFEFEGQPDARALELRYGCDKCPSPDTQWKLFGPPIHETFTLPEMPSDLRSLTPAGGTIVYIIGETHDASEAEDYAEWVNVHNLDVSGTTRAYTQIGLRFWED